MSANKRALVIGATSGIGKELTLQLEKNGWFVCATGRRQELLDELRNLSTESRITTHCFDVTASDTLEQNLAIAAQLLGGMDLFVVSAGTGFLNPDLDPQKEQETVTTNVQAFTALCDWAFRYFLNEDKGHIAAITSVGGLIGEAAAPAYSASKAYQIMYLDGLRALARKKRIPTTITEIRPGSVDTAMMKGEGHFWISSAQKAAALTYEAIAKRKKLQYVSRRWSVIGFFLRIRNLFR